MHSNDLPDPGYQIRICNMVTTLAGIFYLIVRCPKPVLVPDPGYQILICNMVTTLAGIFYLVVRSPIPDSVAHLGYQIIDCVQICARGPFIVWHITVLINNT